MTDPETIPAPVAAFAAELLGVEPPTDEPATPPSALLAACNPLPADLEKWTDAPFPVATTAGGDSNVVLLWASEQFVVGFIWWGKTPETAWTVQSLHWGPNGAFSAGERGAHPSMDLPPPPAQSATEAERLRARVTELQARLDAHPDAPEEWRKTDEAAVTRLQAQIAKLEGPGDEG